MIRKRILIILLFCFSYLYSQTLNFNIPVNKWETIKKYKSNTFNLGILESYNKLIQESYFTLPELPKEKPIFINFKNSTGYTKIYINDKYISSIGSIKLIKKHETQYLDNITIMSNQLYENSINKIKIINYSLVDNYTPIINITNNTESVIPIMLYKKIITTEPIAFTVIIILSILTYFMFREPDEDINNKYYIISLFIFLIYVIFILLKQEFILNEETTLITVPLFVLGWLSLLLYFIKKYRIWNTIKIFKVTITILIIATILSVLNNFKLLPNGNNSILQIIVFLISLLFIYLLNKKNINQLKTLKTSIYVSTIVQLINIISTIIFYAPNLGILDLSIIIILIGHFLSLSEIISSRFDQNTQYTTKLEDTLEKNRIELEKKEAQIIELHNNNEDIIREKSLFFSTLGKNLRAPLNSIIGYGENLYTAKNIDEVTPIVSEIIIESDKIFQTINNIMDFSTSDFTNNDLISKDFRMKEIFENSVYSSSYISEFKDKINYRSIGAGDKVIIKGNPLIYKQMLTSILEFLISLQPDNIDYHILESELTESNIDLEVKITAKNLQLNQSNDIIPLTINKDTFTKYIKLYNMEFTEECNDNDYKVIIKFQFSISDRTNSINNVKLINTQSMELDKQITVLVVEDYIPNLNILKIHLTKMGCEVLTATNGEEAISIFKNEYIDVILMDINMPIMNGWEATEKIRSTEKGLNTLIIGLTASSLDLDIRHCFESGMDDVQVKPIRKKQLYKKLKYIENFNPQQFPTISSLRADYGISKIETETLFISTINQISKQLEILDIFISANDETGINKEIPALLNSSLMINAFYFSRLVRNFENAYKNRETKRVRNILNKLDQIITKVKEDTSDLFRD